MEALSDERYKFSDLVRFGVPLHGKVDEKLSFSLVRRPAPHTHAPWLAWVSIGPMPSQWDRSMFHLARWLVRHLDDPALILWLAERGGQLHDQLVLGIEERLDKLARLEREGKFDELATIRAQAPNAIPRPLLLPIWRLLLTNCIKSSLRNLDLWRWVKRFKRDGLTLTSRFELREILAPKVVLKKPFRWPDVDTEPPERLRNYVDWEIGLAAGQIRSFLHSLSGSARWHDALPVLLDDFQKLLRDALDLRHELGAADDSYDPSLWDLPSISPHHQNRGFRDWVALIELVRDAWLAVWESDTSRATQVARTWFGTPYPALKRLALFAASHDGCIAPADWVDWLLADEAWSLWDVNTKREMLRLLVLQGVHLTPRARGKLEVAILAGPPRLRDRDDIEPGRRQVWMDHAVWLRLAKLKLSGIGLGSVAAGRLAALSEKYPDWRLAENERDEFSVWVLSSEDADFEAGIAIEPAPCKRVELVDWLKRLPDTQTRFYEESWSERCRKQPLNSGYALCDLGQEGRWLTGPWRQALQAWSEKGRARRTWRHFAPQIEAMPANELMEVAPSFTWWLNSVSRTLDCHEAIFFGLCRRILTLPYQDGGDADQLVDLALNHPIGRVAQALLSLWLRREPDDNDKLPPDLEHIFTQICDTTMLQYRSGRVLLASHLITMFRADRSWTKERLLPLFDWEIDADEARAAWQGFLWSVRLYQPLLKALKTRFLDTARYYMELGQHAPQYAALLTYAAIDRVKGYSSRDFQTAFANLPKEALDEAAQALVQALEGAGDQREVYWINRIQPFWQEVWPKARQLASKRIAESLARLSLAANHQFPAVLDVVLVWLQPIEHLHFLVEQLCETGLGETFPEPALRFLDTLIDDQTWPPRELRQCLETIVQTMPTLAQDSRLQRLDAYCRRHGI